MSQLQGDSELVETVTGAEVQARLRRDVEALTRMAALAAGLTSSLRAG